MSATTLPAPITRPNGKVWRGRLPIRFTEFVDGYDDTGFVVFGTHDKDEAARFLGDSRMFEYCLTLDRCEATWWREVPWSNGHGDFSYLTDPERGTPCVVFYP